MGEGRAGDVMLEFVVIMTKARKDIFSVKNIADWTVPPKIQIGLYNILPKLRTNRLTNPQLYEKCAESSKFHNLHKGERCFILATGPSINKENLLPLKDEICISISNFFLHPDAKKIDPLYHVFAPNHSPFDFETIEKEFNIFKNNSSEKTILFLGYSNYQFSQHKFLNAFPGYFSNSYYFINYSSSYPINEINYNNPKIWDISRNPFSIRSVLYSAIQIAAYMGFNEVYLLGVDHHYLDEISQTQGDIHFYPYDQSPIENIGYSYKEEVFLGYYYRWVHYRLMKKYLEMKGIRVFNATEGSFLDVFPSISYKNMLKNWKFSKRA
jgi:hypothetical protein